MKFESFCKKYMPYVRTIRTGDGQNWATTGKVFMKLGADFGVIGATIRDDDAIIENLLNEAEWSQKPAELKHAYLKKPSGKASDIVRVFVDGRNSCNISNEHFGLIEKKDMCVIAQYESNAGEEITALLVGPYVAYIDAFRPVGIILETVEDEK